MMNIFDSMGFENEDTIAICEYNGDIVAVPCENTMSGIYPDYKRSHPLIMGWLYDFKLFKCIDCNNIDAIIFLLYDKEDKNGDKIMEIYFAEDSHDGFQLISDNEED